MLGCTEEQTMKAQFIVLLGARIFSSALQAVSFILLARWAGVQEFGLIAIITGIGSVLFAVADWGLTSYIPRARAKGLNAEVLTGLTMSFWGNIAAGTLFAGVVAMVSDVNGHSAWLWLIPLALAIDQFTETGLTIPIADKEKLVFIISVITRRSLALGSFALLFAVGAEVVLAYSIGLLAAAATGVVHIAVHLNRRLMRESGRTGAKSLYKTLAPYLVANLSSQARTLDTVVVGAVVSVLSAGLYSAAFRLINPLMLISGSIVAVVLPHAAVLPLPAARHLGRKLTALTLVSSLPLLAIIPFATPTIVFLFGHDFSPAAAAFAWAIVAIPFLSLAPPLGGVLQSQGYESFVARNGAIFAIVNLAMVLLGALVWGPAGAAAGVALSYALKSASLYLRLSLARTGPAKHVRPEVYSNVSA
jgi:O-antigen/teichoic acid export membrane protein